MNQAEIRALMNDRVAQRLIQAPIHARLAYTAKDGSPRVIPIGFIWTGDVFVMGSPPIAPKVKALSANPKVALTIDTEDFPPNILLVRGEAALETVDGVPDEFIEAARRFVGDERMPEWEAGARGLYKQMVLIRITPTWAKSSISRPAFPSTWRNWLRRSRSSSGVLIVPSSVKLTCCCWAWGASPSTHTSLRLYSSWRPPPGGRHSPVRRSTGRAGCRAFAA